MNHFLRSFNVFYNLNRSLSYKSAISLENIYPQSSLKLTTPSKPSTDDANNNAFNGYVPIEQLQIMYSKSTGPGGQNVNKVNTKVDVRFHLESANWLSNDIKSKLAEKMKQTITKEGFIVFRSDLTRSQQLNLADCLEKLRSTIRKLCKPIVAPSEETMERIRRRHERAARERLIIKRVHSQTKQARQDPTIKDVL